MSEPSKSPGQPTPPPSVRKRLDPKAWGLADQDQDLRDQELHDQDLCDQQFLNEISPGQHHPSLDYSPPSIDLTGDQAPQLPFHQAPSSQPQSQSPVPARRLFGNNTSGVENDQWDSSAYQRQQTRVTSETADTLHPSTTSGRDKRQRSLDDSNHEVREKRSRSNEPTRDNPNSHRHPIFERKSIRSRQAVKNEPRKRDRSGPQAATNEQPGEPDSHRVQRSSKTTPTRGRGSNAERRSTRSTAAISDVSDYPDEVLLQLNTNPERRSTRSNAAISNVSDYPDEVLLQLNTRTKK